MDCEDDKVGSESHLLIKQGAEARVFESTFVGRRSIVKERVSKKIYRLEMPSLSSMMAAWLTAVDLCELERALLSMHSSSGNVMDRILTAYRKSSKQWSAMHNKLGQVRQRGRKGSMIG